MVTFFVSSAYAVDRAVDHVVIAGATDSSLANRIRAELAALDLGQTPRSRVSVRLEADGRVTILTSGAPPETIAHDADEDLVARKVAESVRASLLAPSEAESPGEAKEITSSASTRSVALSLPSVPSLPSRVSPFHLRVPSCVAPRGSSRRMKRCLCFRFTARAD